ncbi:GntR family transcriptional regulator [Telmatospirillum sp. J64-1]|uniref:GntR family transcriptional regulator n=1 Tax=Telmatospirillum sp. J64-1 TaxID=2502183 RepID=UPI00163D5D2A|nr:FCD domain-containing protein [Telmatospirillum sp. J64-1]
MPVGLSVAPKTLTEEVLGKLRADLLRCRFEPGARLTLESLKEIYDVGFSPLREALMRLAADGLVVREGHKGFRVAPVSKQDLAQAVGARLALEEILLRDAIANGDAMWEANIISNFHVLSKTPIVQEPTEQLDNWLACHKAFHRSLVAAATNDILMDFWLVTFDLTERYRRLTGGNPRDADTEHAALVDAIINRKTELACELTREHIEKTYELIVSLREEN